MNSEIAVHLTQLHILTGKTSEHSKENATSASWHARSKNMQLVQGHDKVHISAPDVYTNEIAYVATCTEWSGNVM